MNDKEKLLRILVDINPDIDYETATALVDSGDFDSLEVMSVVTEMQERFRVEIDPDDIVAENFNSLEAMLKLIEKSR